MKGTQTFLLTHTADAEASKLPYKEWGIMFDFGNVDQTHSSCLHDVHVMDVLRNMRGILHFLIYVSTCVINISTYQRMDEIPQALDKAQHFFHTGNRQNLLLEYPGWAVRAGE